MNIFKKIKSKFKKQNKKENDVVKVLGYSIECLADAERYKEIKEKINKERGQA